MTTKIPKATIEALIDHHPVARFATLDAGQNIHQVPIVFVRYEDMLWSPVDGKPKQGRELARVRNLRINPNVSLLIDSYEQDWSRLWWIRVEGIANIVVAESGTDPHVADAVQALRNKYPQYQDVPVLRKPETLIAIKPTKMTSWCANTINMQ
ncbi:MAG: PPOX class probable F420-dependent enzyme [Gammaproteobacteria bacterium]|jgi:PPOX class probable F420-dependent enzyme